LKLNDHVDLKTFVNVLDNFLFLKACESEQAGKMQSQIIEAAYKRLSSWQAVVNKKQLKEFIASLLGIQNRTNYTVDDMRLNTIGSVDFEDSDLLSTIQQTVDTKQD
jgi:hypothetical protein